MKPRHKVTKAAILLFGSVLIGFGAWAFWQRYRATHNPNPEIPAEIITHSTDNPDETPIPVEQCPEVPAGQPREVELPALGKSGCIQKVGVDQEDKIAVPTSIHVAGWFVDSPLPGEKGVSIIDGHVQGRYEDGIFKNINSLKQGETIKIEYGNGSVREFKVVDTDDYSVEQASQEQFKQLDNITNQLTLLTCGGNFDRASESYDQRTIVRATLL